MDEEYVRQVIAAVIKQLDSLQRAIGSRAVVPQSTLDRVERGLCVKCGEPLIPGERTSRGCHLACYQDTRRQVLSGSITMDEAVGGGLIAPPSKVGRKAGYRKSKKGKP